MDRRQALKYSTQFLGYALVGSAMSSLLGGCKADGSDDFTPKSLTLDSFKLAATLADLILPKTNTPGALDAKVDRYFDAAHANYFSEDQRKSFDDALQYFDNKAISKFKKNFTFLRDKQQIKILDLAVAEWEDDKKSQNNPKEEHPFKLIQSLTVSAFFSSEIAAIEVLNYNPIPGPYVGCVPMDSTNMKNSAI